MPNTINNCRLFFNNTKQDRTKKRAASTKISSVNSKVKRTSIENQLRQAMTIQLDKRLNECARNLNDGKLLAILSGSDVAQELKYHYSCLTALYHKKMAHFSTAEN